MRALPSGKRSDLRTARFQNLLHGKQPVAARAAGEGPHEVGIDGECESTPRGDALAFRIA